jgi:hypothetical protein
MEYVKRDKHAGARGQSSLLYKEDVNGAFDRVWGGLYNLLDSSNPSHHQEKLVDEAVVQGHGLMVFELNRSEAWIQTIRTQAKSGLSGSLHRDPKVNDFV